MKHVPGIRAIVLGGSRARGTSTPDSDIDIGLYYEHEEELDFTELNRVAQALDDDHRDNPITPIGDWGKWVNAGGWLVVDGHQVDLILRDIRRVESVIADCQNGIAMPHYQTGHPHAYIDAVYMGELAVCKIQWTSTERLTELKAVAEIYPPKLKKTLIHLFSFEASFSHMLAVGSIDKDDVYYITAHIVRSLSALNQVIFALNEEYCLNEKKAVRMIESFPIRPLEYKRRVDEVFAQIVPDPNGACDSLKSLIGEVEILCT